MSLLCPKCKTSSMEVLATRNVQGGKRVRRRRRCLSCGYRESTLEVPARLITAVKPA